MIASPSQLGAALNQLARFSDMLEALELDAEAKNDWTQFPLVSKGYFSKIKELNGEIREYLSEHSAELDAVAN
jgi:hypothetical protein